MTALIYVAIIAVWAVVLVPAWLRRHDHLDPERTVDRFTRSMQTLAARPTVLGIPLPEPDRRPRSDESAEVVTVRRPSKSSTRWGKPVGRSDQAPARAGRSAPHPAQRRGPAQGGKRRRARRPRAVTIRRVVLLLLVASLAAVGGLVIAGVILPLALSIPGALFFLFLLLTRVQVRARRRRRAARSPQAKALRQDPEPTVRGTASRPQGGTWEARSAPLPTYVTAPPAPGFPRVIDRTTPGAWTAAAMLERAQQEKLHAERMAAAKAEAVARARAEQAAAEARSRDEEYLAREAAHRKPQPNSTSVYHLRVV
ncbi:MAG: hypothetical protein WCF04_03730, partial [Candidatus Nanopelagicales bacterium]